jgi:hypothetical protein
MQRNLFLMSVCVVFAVQFVAAFLLWAACPTNCTCSKPATALCDQTKPETYGECDPQATMLSCQQRTVTKNHQGSFGSQPNEENETNVGVNASADPVKCLTVYGCHRNEEGDCVRNESGSDTMTQPLKSYVCQ